MPRELIDVALPLDVIDAASSRERSICHGHPSTLHLWWARRSLAASRDVILASLIADPSEPDYPWRDSDETRVDYLKEPFRNVQDPDFTVASVNFVIAKLQEAAKPDTASKVVASSEIQRVSHGFDE